MCSCTRWSLIPSDPAHTHTRTRRIEYMRKRDGPSTHAHTYIGLSTQARTSGWARLPRQLPHAHTHVSRRLRTCTQVSCRTRARTHTLTHARTHARTHALASQLASQPAKLVARMVLVPLTL